MQINVSRPRIVTSTCTHQAKAQAQAEADALDTALVAILQHHELGQCEAVFAPFVSSSIDRRAPSYVACMPHDVCAFESKVHVRCCDKATLRCAFNCSLQLYTTACTAAGVLDRCRGGAHFVLSTLPSAKTAENAQISVVAYTQPKQQHYAVNPVTLAIHAWCGGSVTRSTVWISFTVDSPHHPSKHCNRSTVCRLHHLRPLPPSARHFSAVAKLDRGVVGADSWLAPIDTIPRPRVPALL